MSVLSASSLARSFAGTRVLTQIDMQLDRGTVHGLVGLNGAGKTTLIRLILGILRPDTGTVRVLGFDPWRHCPAMYRRMGVVLEHDGFWGTMTFRQNMRVYAGARGIGTADLERYLSEWWQASGLVDCSRKARHFSRGQRMQCALCRAFLAWPEVVLLDEPTVGLDVDSYEHFGALVREARRRGSAVVVSSHQLDTIESLCDQVSVLEGGVLQSVTSCAAVERWWYVQARDGEGDIAQVLRVAGAGEIAGEGPGLKVELAAGRSAVAGIVEALVGNGWRVDEVRPIGGSLRESLRRHESGSLERERAG